MLSEIRFGAFSLRGSSPFRVGPGHRAPRFRRVHRRERLRAPSLRTRPSRHRRRCGHSGSDAARLRFAASRGVSREPHRSVRHGANDEQPERVSRLAGSRPRADPASRPGRHSSQAVTRPGQASSNAGAPRSRSGGARHGALIVPHTLGPGRRPGPGWTSINAGVASGTSLEPEPPRDSPDRQRNVDSQHDVLRAHHELLAQSNRCRASLPFPPRASSSSSTS